MNERRSVQSWSYAIILICLGRLAENILFSVFRYSSEIVCDNYTAVMSNNLIILDSQGRIRNRFFNWEMLLKLVYTYNEK